MRLIDADALLAGFREDAINTLYSYSGETLRLLCLEVEEAPTIDPDSLVRRGRWDWREEWETHPETHSCDLINCGWHCTECGIELGDYLTKKIGQRVILDDDFRSPELTSCPNCGAKMIDGEAGEDGQQAGT